MTPSFPQRRYAGFLDHRVVGELAGHIQGDVLLDVGASPGAAEGSALPDAAGAELERACGDFLAGFGDADEDALAPAAMAAFERGPHHLGIPRRVDAIIASPVGQIADLPDVLLASPPSGCNACSHA